MAGRAVADDLALALELAAIADEITVGRFRAANLAVETKPDATPVTEADRGVERALRERLAAARPQDAVVGEEYGSETPAPGNGGADATMRWIIDPIDGTKNYVRGIPVWATLIACQREGESVLGVVSAPALHRRWWAARGQGAFVADGLGTHPRPLHVSAIPTLADAQLCFSELGEWEAIGRLEALLELGRRCWRTRGFGDFWGYMLVAEGTAEIACEPEVALWDLAAPQAIVEEAGGRFTDLAGRSRADGGDAVATNGVLHEQALSLIGRQR